ncbi:TraA/ATP-dependent exoDNAse/relaxase (plasmid) [Mycolicibacterium sp. TY66]|uniref:MobF family relaxase n=1 Tax=unclassified Mycolicibacterium TaxID=2636767 RepID=UPI001BB41D75|nr:MULTISPECIES: MobF family relaxase [unclassified Mycolicibacterium]BCI84753.1 TraA/ATP-dependent exoDNAse/relaxase [Mycolicibacterium sp. TY66]BCJ84967.1 TraA/ATP-dependent exoDNAse/relaxase [Mycolicibacterium sp. TY81]
MLTISKLSRWSVNYYEKTANDAQQASMDRQSANGGLGEYYSEKDTRAPQWVVAGDRPQVGELTGLSESDLAGGFADGKAVTRWLDDGIAPNGASGRAFTKASVHGYDLTFAAPKSVGLMRALTDDVAEKVIGEAHMKAVKVAMEYLHQHAGYTRVHNPITGQKDLQRLPGLVGIAYQHETSRCGDPHLHTHLLVPNRQARADGKLASLDGKSLLHEAKAAGVIYQATLRQVLHAELGLEWERVDPHTGMAEIAGITRKCIKAWSRRSTRLREWARDNLVLVDGTPTAQQLAAAQKATRPRKPEALPWAELKAQWRDDERGLELDRAAHHEAGRARRAAQPLTRAQLLAAAAHIDKAAFTRADMVELIGAQTPVDAQGDVRELIENSVDMVAIRVSEPRQAHQREGHTRYTVDAIIAEEERVFQMVDARDNRARIDLRSADVADLSADQARAVTNIAHSPWLVQPLAAPAGAGKTHSLKALRAGAHRGAKEVLVLAPTGKAVDEAMQDGAGDRGMTVHKALGKIEDGTLTITGRTVIVVDEASMVGTPDLKKLLAAATGANAKMVLVGDPYQLAPVNKRGGMFEHLCDTLPWSQQLSQVWRMRDPEERGASLAVRNGTGKRLSKAVKWYRAHDRLHTGDEIAMANDATDAYIAARAAGKDAAIICDRWEIADAINRKLHTHYTKTSGDTVQVARDKSTQKTPTVRVARDQDVRVGDIIISRRNDPTIEVTPGRDHHHGDRVDEVRNGNRWVVADIDPKNGRVAAARLTDTARVVFEGDYLREHVTLGYATTLHSAQGITVGNATTRGAAFTVLSERATRAMAYVGTTRAKDDNHVYIYQPQTNEADHQHGQLVAGEDIHTLHRGNKRTAATLFTRILANNDRPRTLHAEARRTKREYLPDLIDALLTRDDDRTEERTDAQIASRGVVDFGSGVVHAL